MRNLKVIISYNGAAYHGFQCQLNAVTVQETLEIALTKLLNHNTVATGCSRTDAGVHAREFCFNVKTVSPIPADGFVKGLNALLSPDIAVHSCVEVNSDFHARYSAKSKEYAYLICNSPVRNVFMRNLAYFYPRYVDIDAMNKAAKLFIGEHDFSAYCKAESLEIIKQRKHGAVREIYDCRVIRNGDYIEIIISGNGFLHNMVRIISGTLLYVSEDKMRLPDIHKSLSGERRESAGVTLPACGLYLNKVVY